jgi:2'-5' RNA ligase
VAETALIVRVPEAEGHVDALRKRFDASVREGVPTHITILAPFMPPENLDSAVLANLEQAFSKTPAFTFTLLRVKRFVATAYLAPDPAEPFVRLTAAAVRCYPAYPPFGGRHSTVIPHLTVAQGSTEEARLAAGLLCEIIAAKGSITSVCRSVEILENSSGTWRPMASIELPQEHL